MNFEDARALAADAEAAGKVLSVNQNMRFDQSIRVLKQLLERGDLGAPVLATIEMRAIPHWQPFLEKYDRLIKWRVEGANGLAAGTIGWPDYPAGSPSTLRYAAQSTAGE